MLSKYILIDANNLAYRAESGYGKEGNLRTSSGKRNSLVHGFMSLLYNLRTFTSGVMPIVVWDGGYDHRTALSKKGVEYGIVPEAYKENRGEPDPIKESIHEQMPDLRYILSTTNIPQIRKKGYEADDVIASYAKRISSTGESVVAHTVDRDYFQILNRNVILMRRDEMFGYSSFVEKYGIEPRQWVDVGALQGDNGDNIFGVPGIGETTAVEMVRECGDYESVIEKCARELAPLRAEFPDVNDRDEIDWLVSTKASSKTNKYSGCYPGMPFSGVAVAVEKKIVKNVRVNTLMIAMYQHRVRLAYRLKKVVDDINLPEILPFDRYDHNEYDAACRRFEVGEISHYGSAFSCRDIVI